MNELTLYHADYSTCSQKVRIILAEKNIPYKSVPLSFRKEEQLAPDYLKLNPNGVVPTLVHNGAVIVDSSCILEYLDEVFSCVPLRPSSNVQLAKMRAWLRYMEEVPTKAIRTPSFDQVFLPALRLIKTKRAFHKSVEKRTIRKGYYKKMNGGSGFEADEYSDSIYQLRDTALRMSKALESGSWLLGDEFTLVDIAFAPLIDRANDMQMQFLWNDLPNVTDWLTRIQNRDSFQQAFYRGSRLSERLEFKLSMHSAVKRNREAQLSDFLSDKLSGVTQ
ncbi:MAG: glutathione S-transferase family protein [Acidiferrobacterales bacterium]|nr:glutathione S-transferase family protein [Acidiferrobacterales bacterium]